MGKWFGDSQDEEEKYDDEHMYEAVAVCLECPIRRECLLDAFETNEQYGVRGGMTPAQRDSVRNRI